LETLCFDESCTPLLYQTLLFEKALCFDDPMMGTLLRVATTMHSPLSFLFFLYSFDVSLLAEMECVLTFLEREPWNGYQP
jgi:hypothetical protein